MPAAPGAKKGPKAPKKKWSKAKVGDKVDNAVLFKDQAAFDKCLKDVAGMKLITPATVSDRMKITASLAMAVINKLSDEGKITPVIRHNALVVYTNKAK